MLRLVITITKGKVVSGCVITPKVSDTEIHRVTSAIFNSPPHQINKHMTIVIYGAEGGSKRGDFSLSFSFFLYVTFFLSLSLSF